MKTEGTLVVLAPGFPADENDSTCLPMQQSFIRTIGEIYPHIKLVVISFQYPYVQKEYDWHEVKVFSFNGRNKGGVKRLLLRSKIIARLQNLHRTQNIIGLLSFWYNECAAVGEKFGRANGIKHYCWLLGQDVRKGNKYVSRFAIEPERLVALSDFLKEEFSRNYGIQPKHVVPPGINAKHHQLENQNKDIDLLAVGSLIPLKQFEQFVFAVVAIRKHVPRLKALLVGDGPEKERIQQLINEHSLQYCLQLAGECSNKEVVQFMARSKVLFHPSSYEGFGVVLLEALYCGAQVISYVKPMKQDIKGWHVVAGLEEMIAKSILILNEPTSYKSRLVYPMEVVVQNMMHLFLKS